MGRPKGSKNRKCHIDSEGRECSTCGVYKSWSEFSNQLRGANGHTSTCKSCQSDAAKAKRDAANALKPKRLVDEHGKECSKCGEYKPWSKYVKDKHTSDGYTSACYPCRKEQHDKWVERNPEKAQASVNNWIQKNIEYVREKARLEARAYRERVGKEAYCEEVKAYRRDNPDRAREYDKRQYARHRDKRRAYAKEDRQRNPARWSTYDATKRAKRAKGFVPWANQAKIEEFYMLAKLMTKLTGIPHHVDHIVPLAGKTAQGFHVEHNLRVIPAKDNLLKSNRLIEVEEEAPDEHIRRVFDALFENS